MLLRALRDFNVGKLTADDTSIFMGLLNDLFPKTAEHVPRALDTSFEAKVTCPFRRPACLKSICVLSAPEQVCQRVMDYLLTYQDKCKPDSLIAR